MLDIEEGAVHTFEFNDEFYVYDAAALVEA
jgi:hypothetical protein